MIKIEVASILLSPREGVSPKTGKPYSFMEQEAFAYIVNRDGSVAKYPTKMKITRNKDDAPYPVGMYVVAPESLFVDKFANLSVGLVLRPLQAAAVAKAA